MCLVKRAVQQAPKLVGHLGPGVVYIGRAGRGYAGLFGNPVQVGKVCQVCGVVHRTPGSTLPCFKVLFQKRVSTNLAYRQAVLGLAGKQLWCPGCRGGQHCHGQVFRSWFAAGCPI